MYVLLITHWQNLLPDWKTLLVIFFCFLFKNQLACFCKFCSLCLSLFITSGWVHISVRFSQYIKKGRLGNEFYSLSKQYQQKLLLYEPLREKPGSVQKIMDAIAPIFETSQFKRITITIILYLLGSHYLLIHKTDLVHQNGTWQAVKK